MSLLLFLTPNPKPHQALQSALEQQKQTLELPSLLLPPLVFLKCLCFLLLVTIIGYDIYIYIYMFGLERETGMKKTTTTPGYLLGLYRKNGTQNGNYDDRVYIKVYIRVVEEN